MNTLVVSVGRRALASLLLTLLCGVGCTTWQGPSNSPMTTSPWGTLREPSGSAQQFGVNKKSREIEQSLGIQ